MHAGRRRGRGSPPRTSAHGRRWRAPASPRGRSAPARHALSAATGACGDGGQRDRQRPWADHPLAPRAVPSNRALAPPGASGGDDNRSGEDGATSTASLRGLDSSRHAGCRRRPPERRRVRPDHACRRTRTGTAPRSAAPTSPRSRCAERSSARARSPSGSATRSKASARRTVVASRRSRAARRPPSALPRRSGSSASRRAIAAPTSVGSTARSGR